ncbi:IpaD/SipD/SspD family type III secretion system needle tip protein [Serratia liquefaciens]|uniref:IpaD/SipD/SspD family type III secretion system needle tip protein n=1 Tax=Serratia liquefaciens TaxID=614 RepID=UPI00215803C6|nr:IpaD/SipD/SspD family type III secretion system needle tip protein [Serratia liquefaciens]
MLTTNDANDAAPARDVGEAAHAFLSTLPQSPFAETLSGLTARLPGVSLNALGKPVGLTMSASRDAVRLATGDGMAKEAIDAWLAVKTTGSAGHLTALRTVSMENISPCASSFGNFTPSLTPVSGFVSGINPLRSPSLTAKESEFIERYVESLGAYMSRVQTFLADPTSFLYLTDDGRVELTEEGESILFDWDGWFQLNAGQLTPAECDAFVSKLYDAGFDVAYEADYHAITIFLPYSYYDALFLDPNDPKFIPSLEAAAADVIKFQHALEEMVVVHPSSSWDIYKDLSAAIDEMDKNYLKVYADVVSKYTEFFDDVNKTAGSMADMMEVNDDGKIRVSATYTHDLKALASKWAENDVLISDLSPAEAVSWAEALGPLARAEGTEVKIDLSALESIVETAYELTQGSDSWKSPQEFQAFNEELAIHKEKLQSNMQTLIQKYSTANSTFDNLIKVLSSTISSLLESDKSFLNI